MSDLGGDKSRYRLDGKPLGAGGYAEVFRADDKVDGTEVAFKRLRSRLGDSLPRMQREIEVQRTLAPHPHVMPVLDADTGGSWYVMPLALGDLEQLRAQLTDDSALVDVVSQVADALDAAHALGYVHRDVTPRNILAFQAEDATLWRWVVADWGLVRAPRGRTTTRYTKPGHVLGTDGFVAPELMRDAHDEAHPAADVFSIGRVIAWAVTGVWPLAGARLLPEGPFRQLVRIATHEDPTRRPSLDELTAQLRSAIHTPKATVEERATALREAAIAGDLDAASGLFEVASERIDDPDLYFDQVAEVRGDALETLLVDEVASIEVVEAMHEHLTADDDRWGPRPFDRANRPLQWLQEIAAQAASLGKYGVMEDALVALLEAEVIWRRFPQRARTRAWLERLQGEAAETAARCLRGNAVAVDWYREDNWRPSESTEAVIRDALRA